MGYAMYMWNRVLQGLRVSCGTRLLFWGILLFLGVGTCVLWGESFKEKEIILKFRKICIADMQKSVFSIGD